MLVSRVLAFRSDWDTMTSGYDDDRVQRSAIWTRDLKNGALEGGVSIACDNLIDQILRKLRGCGSRGGCPRTVHLIKADKQVAASRVRQCQQRLCYVGTIRFVGGRQPTLELNVEILTRECDKFTQALVVGAIRH